MTGAEIAARTRAEQQLPPHVEDVDVLSRVAALLNISKTSTQATTPSQAKDGAVIDTERHISGERLRTA